MGRIFDKFLCLHEWEQKKQIMVEEERYSSGQSKTRKYPLVLYVCGKCGKMKKVRMA